MLKLTETDLRQWLIRTNAPEPLIDYSNGMDLETLWHYCHEGSWLLWIIGHSRLDKDYRLKRLAINLTANTPVGASKKFYDLIRYHQKHFDVAKAYLENKAKFDDFSEAVKAMATYIWSSDYTMEDVYGRNSVLAPMLGLFTGYEAFFAYDTALQILSLIAGTVEWRKSEVSKHERIYREGFQASLWQADEIRKVFTLSEVQWAVQTTLDAEIREMWKDEIPAEVAKIYFQTNQGEWLKSVDLRKFVQG